MVGHTYLDVATSPALAKKLAPPFYVGPKAPDKLWPAGALVPGAPSVFYRGTDSTDHAAPIIGTFDNPIALFPTNYVFQTLSGADPKKIPSPLPWLDSMDLKWTFDLSVVAQIGGTSQQSQ
jgi:hypothetical protein